MNAFLSWLCVGLSMMIAAFLWFSYLIKIVFNNEIVQERKRRRMRAKELERRKAEDAAKRRKKKL